MLKRLLEMRTPKRKKPPGKRELDAAGGEKGKVRTLFSAP
jgi:hypothetical protein